MKKNLEILDYEDKKTKDNKRYVRFKTSDGWMSCFDSLSNDKLKEFEGKTACCEVVVSGDFSNIKKCYGERDPEAVEDYKTEEINAPVVRPGEAQKSVVKLNGKNTTMYVSYAKDVFLGIVKPDLAVDELKNTMKTAVEIVKQAKEAFE